MAEPWLIRFFACNREMQPFSFFFVGYSLWGGRAGGSGSKFNCAARVGSGRVGSDDLGYGPGSGFSFEPVQTYHLPNVQFKGIQKSFTKLFKDITNYLFKTINLVSGFINYQVMMHNKPNCAKGTLCDIFLLH